MPLPTANTRSGQSQPLTFKVLGRLILTAPQINLLRPGNVLLPESVPDTGLPVTVPQYVGMAVGDMIVLHFLVLTPHCHNAWMQLGHSHSLSPGLRSR